MKRKEFYDALYLAHHGIKGQRWGKRNGPPYPLDEEDHSPKEQNQKKGLTDGQKRAIKIGAALAVAGLATYGAYKLRQSGALSDLGIKKAASVVDISKAREKRETSYYDAVWNETTNTKKPTVQKDLRTLSGKISSLNERNPKGTPENPSGSMSNCMDVSLATIKRWLGVDENAVASENASTIGDLRSFCNKNKLSEKGLTWISETGALKSGSSSEEALGRVQRQILKKFQEGDVGMIGVRWNQRPDKDGDLPGHCFNWKLTNGEVRFFDNQSNPVMADSVIGHFAKYANGKDKIAPNTDVEIVRVTKEAFAK